VASPLQSRELEHPSPILGSMLSGDVASPSDNMWKIPQQPDLTRRKRHPSQLGSPAVLQSPSAVPRSPGLASCGASPTTQHIGLKDLLLSADISPSYHEDTPKRLDTDVRRSSSDKIAGSFLASLGTPSSITTNISSSSLISHQLLPQQQQDSSSWQGRPPLILKSLLADTGPSEGTPENNNSGRMPASISDALRVGSQPHVEDMLGSMCAASGSVVTHSCATPVLSSSSVSFCDTLTSPTNVQRLPSSEITAASQTAHSPLAAMAGLSSLLSNGFVSGANSPVCDTPASVMSRLLVASISSSSIMSTVSQSPTAISLAGKKTTNHLLRVC
jgi:hypothetical protein